MSSLSLFQTSSKIPSGDKNLRFFELPLMTADKRILCPAKSNALRFPIISVALLGLLLTDQLFISIYQTQMNVEHAKEASKFQHKLWENRDLAVQPAITYIYSVCAIMHPVYFFFKQSFCNGPETELKCKTGFRTYIIFAFFNIQTVGA